MQILHPAKYGQRFGIGAAPELVGSDTQDEVAEKVVDPEQPLRQERAEWPEGAEGRKSTGSRLVACPSATPHATRSPMSMRTADRHEPTASVTSAECPQPLAVRQALASLASVSAVREVEEWESTCRSTKKTT